MVFFKEFFVKDILIIFMVFEDLGKVVLFFYLFLDFFVNVVMYLEINVDYVLVVMYVFWYYVSIG